MVLIVVGVASTILVATAPDSEWQAIAIRLGITIALAVPATYCSREAGGHRRVERATRKLELQLASIDPYLAKFPPEERNEIKKSLAERFFSAQALHSSPEDDSIGNQADLIGMSVKQLADLARAAITQLGKK